MDRRVFLALCGAALTIRSMPTQAQEASRLRTIGVLMGLADDRETHARALAIEQGLAKRGWIVGHNLRIEYRYAASDPIQMAKLSHELVALQPDLIVGHSTPVVAALLKATHTIPIVFVVVSDPVGSGFVASLARPGGNVTGFSVLQPTITGKYLSILRELDSKLTRVGLLYNPDAVPSAGVPYTPSFQESANEFKVLPITAEVRSEDQIKSAMTNLATTQHSALIVLPDNYVTVHRKMIISLAADLRIPAIYSYRYYADEGGLLSYGVDVLDLFRRAPDYIDRILRGAKPAELPVQAPRKFELVINMKTARSLGITVPRILLAGADALIE
ncbi:MAG TPA: ABC transporter substrate-binding protein [Xanthobacteraceae bacterium]|nr:ABC transporter substrate-binding protein [Xanthobacteraceae bacterium]